MYRKNTTIWTFVGLSFMSTVLLCKYKKVCTKQYPIAKFRKNNNNKLNSKIKKQNLIYLIMQKNGVKFNMDGVKFKIKITG